MPIPVVIITGFLGCGKTSFLRHLLPICGEAGVRPALVINEVGDVDVDGELLADLHAEQVRLVGGCVCCTLQARLSETIYELVERREHDVILIECSGLSNPIDVVNALSAPALLSEVAVSQVVCLVDAARAVKILSVAEMAKAQVGTANLVIMNKSDLVGDRRAPEGAVAELAPKAELVWATHGEIGRERLMRLLTDGVPVISGCSCHGHSHEHSHELPASFCTVALPLPETVGRESLERLLGSLPENVIRAKGFANLVGEGWHAMHKVYDCASLSPLGTTPKIGAVLVCIGQHLSAERLSELVATAE
ncbi:MAG: CobW family GTP-binding protein [Armatimonadota bacterium]